LAQQKNLDLVEVSPAANPPVCRIMNFGKYRYEEKRKERLARKNQSATVLKEVKFHANVEEHDYQTKVNRINSFLEKGHKVKASLFFRGRENEHRELGIDLFEKIIEDIKEQGAPESPPKMFGNNLVMLLIPNK
jgi:translation initiation factor IF-3